MQEVFEKIIEKFSNINRVVKNDEDLEWNRAVYKCMEIVKQAAAEHNNGWIPCSERLPDECEYYLVCDELSTFIAEYADDEWRYHSVDNTKDYHIVNIIAWQPLPDPYQPHICTNNYCTLNEGKDCPAAEGCPGYERNETNADRIRSMSDEELADLLESAEAAGYNDDSITPKDEHGFNMDMIKWPQSEVEE